MAVRGKSGAWSFFPATLEHGVKSSWKLMSLRPSVFTYPLDRVPSTGDNVSTFTPHLKERMLPAIKPARVPWIITLAEVFDLFHCRFVCHYSKMWGVFLPHYTGNLGGKLVLDLNLIRTPKKETIRSIFVLSLVVGKKKKDFLQKCNICCKILWDCDFFSCKIVKKKIIIHF